MLKKKFTTTVVLSGLLCGALPAVAADSLMLLEIRGKAPHQEYVIGVIDRSRCPDERLLIHAPNCAVARELFTVPVPDRAKKTKTEPAPATEPPVIQGDPLNWTLELL